MLSRPRKKIIHSAGLQPHLPDNLLGKDVGILVQVLEQSANSVIITDHQGIIQYVNQSFVEVTGYSRQEVLGQHTRIFKSGMQTQDFYRNLWHTIQGKESWSGEFVNRKKDGELFYEFATINPVVDTQDQITHFVAIKENITKTKLAQKALQSERRQLREIIDLVPHMIFVRDKANRYLLINRAMASFFKLPPDQIIGKTDLELNDDKAAAQLSAEDDLQVLSSQKPVAHSDFVIRMNTEEIRHFQSVKVPFHLAGDDKDVVLGIMVDITDQIIREQQLIQTREEALKASGEKAVFLSVMSHEIRTPLIAIVGMARLLQSNSPDAEFLENIEVLKFSAENLMSLINDILDFSKMEGGKVEIENRPFNLKSHLKNISKAMAARAREKNIELKEKIEDTVPDFICGDSLRLGQIINNLLGNAIKFTPAGRVVLQVKMLNQLPEQATISFSVMDTGIGIPPDKIDLLFEPYAQAGADTSRKYGGTGLGLTITKQLVEAMGGKIEVESKLGQGSSFSFFLTLKTISTLDPEQSTRVEQPASPSEISGANILMVEDNVMSIILARKIFSKWNLNLTLAETGEVALEKIARKAFDLILLDLQMPDMDGFQIMEVIKTPGRSQNLNTPVMAFSATIDAKIHEKALNAGMIDFVVKPYQPEDLLERIMIHLRKHPQSTRNEKPQRETLHNNLKNMYRNNPDALFGLKQQLAQFLDIMSLPSEEIFENHRLTLEQEMLPVLRALCQERATGTTEDYLRILDTYSGQNRGFLLNAIRNGIKNQVLALLDNINALTDEKKS